ncbi:MAG: OsmC family protein [bacterium]
MIITSNDKENSCESFFTSGDLNAINNLSSKYKSETGGCRAYALLEASLGYCLSITIREFAQTHNIELDKVKLDLSNCENPVVEKNIELIGNLSDLDRQKLIKASEACSIYKALLKGIAFKEV